MYIVQDTFVEIPDGMRLFCCPGVVGHHDNGLMRLTIEPIHQIENLLSRNPVEVSGRDLAVGIARACPDLRFAFVESWPLSADERAWLDAACAGLANVERRPRVDDLRLLAGLGWALATASSSPLIGFAPARALSSLSNSVIDSEVLFVWTPPPADQLPLVRIGLNVENTPYE